MKEIKLKELEKGLESGIISRDEYEKRKKEIESAPKKKREEAKDEVKDHKFKSDKMLIIGAIVLVLVFAGLFSLKFINQEKPETIEDLHALNIKGKLKPEQGFVYNGLSFVNIDDFWYTQLQSQSGRTFYNFNFRYSPRDLEDVLIKGNLDLEKFNNATEYYVTFNPFGDELTHIRLARLDYDLQMIKVFKKTPLSACDRNASACFGVPIITCDNTEDIVVYFKEADRLSVEYKSNCIIISARGLDFVKGVDRVLYDFYGIMER